MRAERLLVAALACFAFTPLLGALVAARPPGRIDLAFFALRGHGVGAAYLFTLLGRWPTLLTVGVVALGIAMTLRERLVPVVVILGAQVVSQGSAALLKLAFHRPRPAVYLGVREPDFSYPSGHAVTAMVFFLGFAVLAAYAPFPRPVSAAIAGALAACAGGIAWSRLALGAHFATDVLGGLVFGTGWLCVALAIVLRTLVSRAP